MEQNGQAAAAVVEAPRGMLPARVDEKGRLKLPAAIAQYLGAIGESKVFITSLNISTALIYPISVWNENEKFLSEAGEDADARAEIALLANHYGEDAEVDGQGRVLMPTTLRRDLELEKDDVHLLVYKGRIEVFGSKVYAAQLAKAKEGVAEKLAALNKKGLR